MDPTPPSTTTTHGGATATKLRLMCSYGGHIVPRPLDKTLCYAGGETRIVAVDRKTASSITALKNHLSKTIFQNGKPFSLKYQLPNHDLDSLISISTDEDVTNMIDEYDRLTGDGGGGSQSGRLRFFLFPACGGGGDGERDEYDPTSEEWFVDALRNVGVVAKGGGDGGEMIGGGGGLQESIVMEKNSSYGSTSSSASNSNSPAIRSGGGGEDGGCGGGGGAVRVHDFKIALPSVDSIGSDSSLASPHFSPHAIAYQDAPAFVESKVVATNLVETDSNASDRSPRSDLLTPVQVPGYILNKPLDQQQQQVSPLPPPPQQQYIHQPPQSHYVTTQAQYYPSPVQVASYQTMYQPYVQPQQPVQYPTINKPYPVYMMPVGQTQSPYDMPSNPVMLAPPVVYEGYKPTPEYAAAKVYRTPAVASQQVHLPSDHHQVVTFPPVNQPTQPVAAVSAAPPPPLENANYVSDYEDPMHAQIYKTQPPGPTLSSQLQTAANAPAVMLSEAFSQLHVDKTKL